MVSGSVWTSTQSEGIRLRQRVRDSHRIVNIIRRLQKIAQVFESLISLLVDLVYRKKKGTGVGSYRCALKLDRDTLQGQSD